MKRFIDENGIFEIKVPVTWRYLLDGKVHTFQEYEIWKSDAFQLSIRELKDENQRKYFLQEFSKLNKVTIGQLEYFCYPDSGDTDFTIKSWIRIFDNRIVLFTLTHPNNPDKDLDSRSIEEKISIVFSIIKEFKLIEQTNKEEVINRYRFEVFLQGVGATSLMLNKSVKSKAFIEATCIIANQIDALLRIGIVLKKQLLNGNNLIETKWIYQGLSDKIISEKDVYKESLNLGIITQEIFDNLYQLYNDRNRVVHRFIISVITLAEAEEISYKYYKKSEELNQIIYNLEAEQIKLNVGMTIKGGQAQEGHILDFIKGKIGKLNYFEDK